MVNKKFSLYSSAIGSLSIKKLILLGFTLVALPLVIALVYSTTKVNLMSKQSTEAIFSVVALTKVNRELSEDQLTLERYASQYIVLKDTELKVSYLAQEQKVIAIINDNLTVYNDEKLSQLTQEYLLVITVIVNYLMLKTSMIIL